MSGVQAGATKVAVLAAAATVAGTLVGVAAQARPAAAAAKPVTPRAPQVAAAPRFSAATATTFVVTTTKDLDPHDPNGTTCVDTAGTCSLRAAVAAANNLAEPVNVLLTKATYKLSLGTALSITNPAGTSISGKGAAATKIRGVGSGVLDVRPPATTAASPLLFLTGVTITGGRASYGGGLYLGSASSGADAVGSTAVVDNDVFTGNAAANGGGAIGADSEESVSTLYLTGTTVRNNSAPAGAGLYLTWVDSDIANSHIVGNATTAGQDGEGGGIYNYYGYLYATGSTIRDNTAAAAADPGTGGGVYDEYGTVRLDDVTVDGNAAAGNGAGGGIYSREDQLQMTGGSVSHNSATDGTGGGLSVDYGSQVELHGVTMTANTVGNGYGGAVYDHGQAFGNSVLIDQHSTLEQNDGGAIYTESDNGFVDLTVDHSTVSANTGSGCGGAVCMYGRQEGGLTLRMTHDVIGNNTGAGGAAGALDIHSEYHAGASAYVADTVFRGNDAGAAGYGGAIYVYDDGQNSPNSLHLVRDTFIGNRAGAAGAGNGGHGGALALSDYATVDDQGSRFTGNSTVGPGSAGGAVWDGALQSGHFTGTRFLDNHTGTDGLGGALYSGNLSGEVFDHVTMSGNTAASGGGYYGDYNVFQVAFSDSTVSGNTAGTGTTQGHGGGIASSNALVALANTTVADNTASSAAGRPGQGGGIWEQNGALALRYSTVSGNFARRGGGIFEDGSNGSVLASIVSGNRAAARGAESDCALGAPAAASIGQNVLGQSACVSAARPTDKISRAPGLRRLAGYGGPVATMALAARSPALGRGGYHCPATDARGERRAARGCDAGAYQRAPGIVRSVRHGKGRPGTKITIVGSGFTFTRAVVIGGKHARYRVRSDTELLAWAPPHRAGKTQVAVTTADGAGRRGHFTYRRA